MVEQLEAAAYSSVVTNTRKYFRNPTRSQNVIDRTHAMHVRLIIAAAKLYCVLLLALTSAGCACSCPRCAPNTSPGWQPNCGIPNPCFGYYSTCWRMWSSECPTCPAFQLPPSLPSGEFRSPAPEPLAPTDT